jgi:hypothetical protein
MRFGYIKKGCKMAVSSTPRFSERQVEQFHREGYMIVPEPIFAPAKFQRLVDHFETKLAALPPGARPEAMDVPHFTDPALFEWLLADEVLDLIEPLLGPDIALFSSHFICKPQGDGRRVPWHEDSAYWKGMMDPMKVVTVWLAIDPSTRENGCMYVVPRTHNTGMQGFSDYDQVDVTHNVFPTEITPTQRHDALAIPCELAPNHASLHDGRLIHGSPPNTSSQRRCGYTMRYASTDCRLSDAFLDVHQFYLARGRNLGGQTYGDPGQAYSALLSNRVQSGRKSH